MTPKYLFLAPLLLAASSQTSAAPMPMPVAPLGALTDDLIQAGSKAMTSIKGLGSRLATNVGNSRAAAQPSLVDGVPVSASKGFATNLQQKFQSLSTHPVSQRIQETVKSQGPNILTHLGSAAATKIATKVGLGVAAAGAGSAAAIGVEHQRHDRRNGASTSNPDATVSQLEAERDAQREFEELFGSARKSTHDYHRMRFSEETPDFGQQLPFKRPAAADFDAASQQGSSDEMGDFFGMDDEFFSAPMEFDNEDMGFLNTRPARISSSSSDFFDAESSNGDY